MPWLFSGLYTGFHVAGVPGRRRPLRVESVGAGYPSVSEFGLSSGHAVPDASGELVEVPDYLNLIVEVKGYRGEDAKQKKLTMDSYWIPGVNQLNKYGRWAFEELTDLYAMQNDFEQKLSEALASAIEQGITQAQQPSAPLISTPDSHKTDREKQGKPQGEQA